MKLNDVAKAISSASADSPFVIDRDELVDLRWVTPSFEKTLLKFLALEGVKSVECKFDRVRQSYSFFPASRTAQPAFVGEGPADEQTSRI